MFKLFATPAGASFYSGPQQQSPERGFPVFAHFGSTPPVDAYMGGSGLYVGNAQSEGLNELSSIVLNSGNAFQYATPGQIRQDFLLLSHSVRKPHRNRPRRD